MDYVLSIDEHRSISKAAAALFISQPHLSKVLMRVERELGAKLFDRSTVPLTSTKEGELFIRYCRKFKSLTDELRRELKDIADTPSDSLLISTPPIRGSYWMPLILPLFAKASPKTQLVIKEYSSKVTPEKVADGTVDLGVFTWPATRDDLVYHKLFDERTLLMVPKQHPLAAASASMPRSLGYPVLQDDMLHHLEGEKFITIDTPHSITKKIVTYLQERGINADIGIKTKNNVTTYRLCESGMGVAVIMEAAVNNTSFHNDPIFLQVGDPPLTEPWHTAYRKSYCLSPAGKMFLELVSQHIPSLFVAAHNSNAIG